VNWLDRLKGGQRDVPAISSLDELAAWYGSVAFGGWSYPLSSFQQTLASVGTERPADTFVGLSTGAHSVNAVVFACMSLRQSVFSSVRFTWRRLRNGSPSDTFGSPELRLLERPWPGGTTQDMLSRMNQDTDLAGNSYWTRQGSQLVRLRPDWVEIIATPRRIGKQSGQVGWEKLGYRYTEGGPNSGAESVAFTVDEVAHFAPIPDPQSVFSGMSWLTPVLREIQNDQSMGRHQRAFFDNGATVNMVIRHAPGAAQDKVQKWVEEFEDKYKGPSNAYKSGRT
jgi:phage portal protein BeeE